MLGAAAAPATAARPPGNGQTETAAVKAKPAKVRAGKSVKGAQPLTAQKRVVLKRIAATRTALARQALRVEASGIPQTSIVRVNITADLAVLDGHAATLRTATTLSEVRAVATLVAATAVEVHELTALAEAKALEGHDVAAVRSALAGVTTATGELPAAGAAVADAGIVLTAQSTAADRAAFAALVETLEVLLDEVEAGLVEAEALLAALVPVVEPVEEPTV